MPRDVSQAARHAIFNDAPELARERDRDVMHTSLTHFLQTRPHRHVKDALPNDRSGPAAGRAKRARQTHLFLLRDILLDVECIVWTGGANSQVKRARLTRHADGAHSTHRGAQHLCVGSPERRQLYDNNDDDGTTTTTTNNNN